MSTATKSWQTSADSVIRDIFQNRTVPNLSDVVDSVYRMSDSLDFTLAKTNGLTNLGEDSLLTQYGNTIWEYLSHESISSLQELGFDLTPELMLDILVSKQRDYGPNNIARFGTAGILIRMHDKIARLLNLLQKCGNDFNRAVHINSVPNESIIDTLIDVIGYSVIAVMWSRIDEESGKPEFLLSLD